jgi:hypothetical protein
LDVGVAESHIIPGNAKDNFWGTGCPTLVLTLSQLGLQKWALPVLAGLQGTDLSPSDLYPLSLILIQ